MKRTGLEHAQIDDYARLTLVACYDHPSTLTQKEILASSPVDPVVEDVIGGAFRTECEVVDTSVMVNGDSFESWMTVCLKDPIFKYENVEEKFKELEDEFDIGANLDTSASRIMVTSEDQEDGVRPFSRPTIVYEAHVNFQVPADVLGNSLTNVENTYREFKYEGRHSKRVDLFVGDRNILYACSDGGRSGFNDAKRITKLLDSMLSSKGIQYNGVFVSMFDSPLQKEL